MIRKTRLLIAAIALCWSAALAETSQAQQILASPRMGGYPTGGQLDPIGAGGVGRPSVSPYTNLYLADAIGMTGTYQTMVQPFVAQNQINNTQTASIQRLQRQVSTVEPTAPTRRPNQIIRNTGHQTRSLNYSHYYPTTNSSYQQ